MRAGKSEREKARASESKQEQARASKSQRESARESECVKESRDCIMSYPCMFILENKRIVLRVIVDKKDKKCHLVYAC